MIIASLHHHVSLEKCTHRQANLSPNRDTLDTNFFSHPTPKTNTYWHPSLMSAAHPYGIGVSKRNGDYSKSVFIVVLFISLRQKRMLLCMLIWRFCSFCMYKCVLRGSNGQQFRVLNGFHFGEIETDSIYNPFKSSRTSFCIFLNQSTSTNFLSKLSSTSYQILWVTICRKFSKKRLIATAILHFRL